MAWREQMSGMPLASFGEMRFFAASGVSFRTASPMVRIGECQVVEAVVASGADQHAKVEGPLAQMGDDVLAVA